MATAEIQNDDDNLENLLAKATNPLHREPDPEATAAFCSLIDTLRDGPQTALRLLAHKIQSPIEKESLMALSVLEESVKKCGCKYRSEVGKFRFLNEMIKVVSPKYLGSRASSKVKQKIVELMFLWSMDLKSETKIFEAYQMLKRQGVVIEDPVYILDNYEPPPPPPPRPKNSIFEDDEKAQQLQKLLRSRNPEDLQAANRLIKNMVREADKKMELMAKRSTELETVHNNASVLADMLEHYKPGEASEEEKDLMKELFESCERLRPKLFRLAGELDEKDEGLGEILKANDELTVVINNYKKKMGVPSENGSSNTKEASLLDLGSPVQESQSAAANSSLLDDQLLALGLGEPDAQSSTNVKSTSASNAATSATLADLDQIFKNSKTNIDDMKPSFSSAASLKPASTVNSVINDYTANVLLSGDTSGVPSLTPVPTIANSSVNSVSQISSSAVLSKGLEELDELGQSLLKKSLPVTSAVKYEFPSTPQKVPLSQLIQQQKVQTKIEKLSSPILSSTVTSTQVTPNSPSVTEASLSSDRISPVNSPAHSSVLSLKDVFVPLETIRPGSISPLNLHEKNGLNIVIHFGKDSPRPDITVMVVSTMSKNSSPVKNVSFQAAVPKSMKIKLQPPSATDLPPHNPILPPAAITQVMLLANPLKENVRFKYKVNYTINGVDFTDLGEVDSLLAPR
ncbi:ADP-ribosylation factor-binding protein GGA1-like [Stegodyphus dumicola]|uniref:ADP-ribosylation factor-binding protein GGA1-like n=1 Tax=Stegodyphus dumicola TaxID=202533 RepID=UPI0015B32EE9|nr:ADP-ribosylation factor-binding protein GGA1-like [Stegodyphus dumicola]